MTVSLDPGGLGLGLIFLIALAPVVARSSLGCRSGWSPVASARSGALVIGFVLFNLLIVAAFFGWAFVKRRVGLRLVWMMLKTFVFVFIFVQMRGTRARPSGPADELRWKLAPAGVAPQHLRDRDRRLDPGEPVRAGA